MEINRDRMAAGARKGGVDYSQAGFIFIATVMTSRAGGLKGLVYLRVL